jgi:hypothetical protein
LTLTAWLKSDDLAAGGVIGLVAYDKQLRSAAKADSQPAPAGQAASPASNVWLLVEATLDVPVTARYVEVVAQQIGPHPLWIDDLHLSVARDGPNPPPPEEVLRNPDFEE